MARRVAIIILVGIFILQACDFPVRITGLNPTSEVGTSETLPFETPPPEAPASEVSPATAQPTLESTQAPTTPQSQRATITPQPKPSQTPTPTQTATIARLTTTAAPAAAARSLEPEYVLQPGSPSWLTNFTHPEAGCNWFGIAGQVFNTQNEPVTSLVIMVEGRLYGEPVRFLSLTGVAPIYGPGGYEIVLGNRPVRTKDRLRIQLFDLAGDPLSEPVTFDTFARCERNLILMNFVDELPAPGDIRYYFPVFLSSVIVE